MTKYIFLFAVCFSLIFASSNNQKNSILKEYDYFDSVRNNESSIECYLSNFGIFAQNTRYTTGGGYWPRDGRNQYIFGTGFWFGTKKIINNKEKKLVVLSYNPNTGQSWMVPGRIDDSNILNKNISQSRYRIYRSTDFDLVSGSDMYGDEKWPLWISNKNKHTFLNLPTYEYEDDADKRNLNYNPEGPLFYSDEMFYSTYKDTDTNFYETFEEGDDLSPYPIGIQTDEMIFSWENGKLQDVIVVVYTITNKSGEDLYENWFAPIIDFDIALSPNTSFGAGNDYSRYFYEMPDYNLAVAWTGTDRGEKDNGFGYVGVTLLESPSIDNDGYLNHDKEIYPLKDQKGICTFRNWTVEDDPENSTDRYDFISSKKFDTNINFRDIRNMFSVGPFNLKKNESVRFALAYIFAESNNYDDTLEVYYADGSCKDLSGFSIEELKNGKSPKFKTLLYKYLSIRNKYYEGVTSVNQNNSMYDIKIKPEPADEYIDITINKLSKSSKLEIYDVLGNKVFSQSIKVMTRNHRINVAYLNKGVYFIKIDNVVKKFVKM